jgi:hypothetical protein
MVPQFTFMTVHTRRQSMVIAEVFMPFMWVFSAIDVSTQVEPLFTCKEQIITT